MNAEQIFLDYTSRYDDSNGKIKLKIIHTLAVADVMDKLTAALHLSEHQRYLAHICAVFHDIGRFEQVKRYNTFVDSKSVDHAALGCEVLEEEGFLNDLEVEDRNRIITAIRNHNQFVIEEGLDEETLLLCKLIRDADKCDIYRVFACDNMVDVVGETEEQIATETVSDEVYEDIFLHRCVERGRRKSCLDKWVGFLSFFFDMNFSESIALLTDARYYRRPFDRTTFTNPDTARKIAGILDEIEHYIQERVLESTKK